MLFEFFLRSLHRRLLRRKVLVPIEDTFHFMNEELTSGYLDRFSGIARLYGQEALPVFRRSHVAVVGIGGVGSWTAEALVRSGVGEITLIDLDEVCVTNVNRQLPAMDGQVGRFKVHAVAERLRLINPECMVHEEVAFFTDKTADRILETRFDGIVDAIDSLSQKAFLIATARERGFTLVAAGGAGGKRRPGSIRTDDLAFATNDRLLRLVRKKLRQDYDFPSEATKSAFGVRAVYSVENARFPWSDGTVREEPEPGSHLRLNCETGFGTATPVTGGFGFAAAAEILEEILRRETSGK
ncbi:MAG: tRNA threonylcarbamoyladenosine dehydratase [Verrucomicrobiota bacterium]